MHFFLKISICPIVLFCTCFVLTGCSRGKANNKNLAFDLKMEEEIADSNRTLRLCFSTKEYYHRTSLGLKSAHKVTEGKKIRIRFENYDLKDSSTSGNLVDTILLKNISDGVYILLMNMCGKEIQGKLLVTEKSYHLEIPHQRMLDIINPDLNKLPFNTIFGQIHFYRTSSLPLVHQFLDSLSKMGARKSIYPSGNYNYFNILPDGQIRQERDPGYKYTQSFIYNYKGSLEKLKSLVHDFSYCYNESVVITLSTTEGQIFNIWSD